MLNVQDRATVWNGLETAQQQAGVWQPLLMARHV
jgi:hypothetical protein